MRALIQRVEYCKVHVAGETVAAINTGLLVFLGVDKLDSELSADKLLAKILQYRVFPGLNGKMNLCLREINGELLIVSQFTLSADTRKGLRPSFSSAAEPVKARLLYDYFVTRAARELPEVATGVFGADMKVELVNDGPVTFLLEVN